jgi:uncharacterized protein (DUF342 family)
MEVKYRYDLLALENASLARINEFLTSSLHQRDEQEHAAQRRIQELERMVKPLRSIVAQMQNRESRLKACEQQMSNLTDLFEKLVRTTQDRNGAPLLSEEQTGVPELSQSVNEQELGTASKSAGQ